MYVAKRSGRNRVSIADIKVDAPVNQESTEDLDGDSSSQEGMPGYLQDIFLHSAGKDGNDPSSELVAVQALTIAASAHDRGTSAHSQRMIRLAEATARILGRPEEELELVRLGALLHDIGKIGIPEAILHKPGPLTDEEWEIMRSHPLIGRQILEQLGGVFQLLSRIIVAHHERWDGQGYPHGLAKEAIPMSARILSVVDSYDAMTSDRPYRPAMAVADAIAELQRCAGRQYDPQVVQAFLKGLDEVDAGEVTASVEVRSGERISVLDTTQQVEAGFIETSPSRGDSLRSPKEG
jgi:putative nucleotidyltransferase with HDIG domain